MRMHSPDGFLNVAVSIGTGVVAAGAIAIAIPMARKAQLDDRQAPMIGIVATVIFAAQMVNFPVGAGTSGHLLGGALAAVLVGPWAAVLVMSVVLIVQALIFADGGITALGTNISAMGIVTIAVGWVVFVGLSKLLPARRWSLMLAGALGALLSVPAAAVAFTGLFLLGGQAPVAAGTVFTAMVGWHLLIGIGEAAITAAILTAVVVARPDLVHGSRFWSYEPGPPASAHLIGGLHRGRARNHAPDRLLPQPRRVRGS
jgi:cobalt/nickel transport system permease protein